MIAPPTSLERLRLGMGCAAIVALGLASGCASTRPRAPGREGSVEVGMASFYARSFEGRRTANGERYDGRAMTCAHRYHPFGTILRVTDVATGRSVVVRVTDRGPYAPGRVVDLSFAAARALGILDRGVVRVRVEMLERGRGLDQASAAPDPEPGLPPDQAARPADAVSAFLRIAAIARA